MPNRSRATRSWVYRSAKDEGGIIGFGSTNDLREPGSIIFVNAPFPVLEEERLPTPALAMLTRAMRCDLGVVISASHNPFEDNGIKVFSGRGEKFTETLERHVESIVADTSWPNFGTKPSRIATKVPISTRPVPPVSSASFRCCR